MSVARKLKAKTQTKIFHATMLVTRAEEWWVEAETIEEAQGLLGSGQGHHATLGEVFISNLTRCLRRMRFGPANAFYSLRGKLLAQSHDELLKGDFLVFRSNILFLIIGALVIVVAVMGYELYQDRKQPEGMRIDVGPNGLKIEKK